MPSETQANDAPAATSRSPSSDRDRLVGLDGIRGLAALFVVLHHCWLVSFPGYPANTGPVWVGWLPYGHLAVVVFIVLSGFSLALAPARSDWRIGRLRRFFRRRAWRILPPYWAALILSLVIAWTLVPQPGAGPPTAKSVLIHGLLLQDVFGSPSPNSALWSIAIEAQLYLVFPLMILIRRRVGAAALLGLVTAIAVAIELLSDWVHLIGMLRRFIPQLAVLFSVGIVATTAVTSPIRTRAPWLLLTMAAATPVLLLILRQGPQWTVEHYFWVDLAVGPAVAFLLIAVSLHRSPLVGWLTSQPLRRLGSFSYSLYLTHAPIVIVAYHFIAAPHTGVPAFLVTLAVTVPVALTVAYLFACIFEFPFLRHRSFQDLISTGRKGLFRNRFQIGRR